MIAGANGVAEASSAGNARNSKQAEAVRNDSLRSTENNHVQSLSAKNIGPAISMISMNESLLVSTPATKLGAAHTSAANLVLASAAVSARYSDRSTSTEQRRPNWFGFSDQPRNLFQSFHQGSIPGMRTRPSAPATSTATDAAPNATAIQVTRRKRRPVSGRTTMRQVKAAKSRYATVSCAAEAVSRNSSVASPMSKPTLWATAKTSQKISSCESAGVNGGPSRPASWNSARTTQIARHNSPGPIGIPGTRSWCAVDNSSPTASSASRIIGKPRNQNASGAPRQNLAADVLNEREGPP